jgi:hypothetical protein
MKAYRGMEVKLHTFCISAVCGDQCYCSYSSHINLREIVTMEWWQSGPQSSLKMFAKRKIPALAGYQIPAFQPIASHLTDCASVAHKLF